MRVLKSVVWEKIEVGEIFAIEGCWSVLEKVSKTKARFLATDADYSFCGSFVAIPGNIYKEDGFGDFIKPSDENAPLPSCLVAVGCYDCFYRLPQSTQSLWKEE